MPFHLHARASYLAGPFSQSRCGDMEEIYIVKVRTEPDPARLYPSERRYSAFTVGGLGAVHLLLAATSFLLGGLGLALQSDSCWTGRYGGGLWLGIASAAAGAAGILAWRRWYVDNNIRWFFISSTVAATTSLLCLIITAAALSAILEQRSNQELYRSIYYDQGFVHQHDVQEQPIEINNNEALPSLSLQESQQNDSHLEDTYGRVEEITKLPPSFHQSHIINKEGDHSQTSKASLEQSSISDILYYPQDVSQHNTSEHQTPENEKSKYHKVHTRIAPENIIQNMGNVSAHDPIISTSTDTSSDFEMWKQTETMIENQNGQVSPENSGTRERHNSEMVQDNSKTKSFEVIQETNGRDKTIDESTHIMRIANVITNKTNHVFRESLNDHDLKLDTPTSTEVENQFNRSKKSAENYQRKDLLHTNDGHSKIVIIEDEHVYPNVFNNDETRDVITIPTIRYESQEGENVPEIIHSPYDSNETHSKFASPQQRLEQQEQPQYEKVTKGGREIRTVVAINILVASALELAWSLLSASIAWKGMKNCYPHENTSNNCERTVEGLERSPPPPPPSSNYTYPSNKRHHKINSIFRKPDIISNHRHCDTENSIHLSAVQNKNGINRLHMINTVSERINIEPYLPMEESTMEYQERVHRFLASNNVASNADS